MYDNLTGRVHSSFGVQEISIYFREKNRDRHKHLYDEEDLCIHRFLFKTPNLKFSEVKGMYSNCFIHGRVQNKTTINWIYEATKWTKAVKELTFALACGISSLLKGATRSLGEEINTQSLNIYNNNDLM